MRDIKVIGLIALIILSIKACKDSSLTNSNISIQKSDELNHNDSIKEIIETRKYDSIEETNDWYKDDDDNFKKLKLIKVNGKIGFLNEDGEELFPCIFDSVIDVKNYEYKTVNDKYIPVKKAYFTHSNNQNQYAKVKMDGKWGLITINGIVEIPCIYDEIFDFDHTKTIYIEGEGPLIDFWDYSGKMAVVKKGEKWGLINTKGDILADITYDEFFIPNVKLFYENRAAAKKDGKWGFLNEKGKPVIPFVYDTIGSTYLINPKDIATFKEGIAVVKKDGKWGAIDIDGNEKVPFIYDYISNFNKERTIAQKNGKWGYINKIGLEIIPLIYDKIKWFEYGLCPVKKDEFWSFINEKGELVVPLEYDDILVSNKTSFEGGLWFFSQDGFCAVKKNGKWGLIDKDNNTVVNFEYEGIKFTSSGLDDWRYFSDGYLSVKKGKFWSVINKNGLSRIPFEYDDVEIWSEGKVCVKKNNKWGQLDSLGRLIVPIEQKNAIDAGNFNYYKKQKKKKESNN